jgi:hypothetical protein
VAAWQRDTEKAALRLRCGYILLSTAISEGWHRGFSGASYDCGLVAYSDPPFTKSQSTLCTAANYMQRGDSTVMTTIKRRVPIENNLYFEYEVSPHRAILARRSEVEANDLRGSTISCQASIEFLSQSSDDDAQLDESKRVTGLHIPFKQVRLKGQINPLKPPLHVETVLIGRALGQPTGYLAGVGFRIRDDGYVEGEFEHGTEKFLSFGDFQKAVKICLEQTSDDNG